MSQLKALYDFFIAAQYTTYDANITKALNKRLIQQAENATRELTYVLLVSNLELIVFTNASFANNKDFSLQIKYVIVLTNKQGIANILYQLLIKYKRVTKSVLSAKLYAIAHGFDIKTFIKTTLSAILLITLIPLVLTIDSKFLFDYIVKLSTT